MSSIRELRKKIKTVKQIRQITQAMKMVAAAKLRHVQQKVINARPYADKMSSLLNHLASERYYEMPDELTGFFVKPKDNKYALLAVSSDKGLCGSFNTSLQLAVHQYIKENGEPSSRFDFGRKMNDFFIRNKAVLDKSYINIMNKVCFAHAEIIAREIMQKYKRGEFTRVVAICGEFKSMLSQKPAIVTLLPVIPDLQSVNKEYAFTNFEPSKDKILSSLLPRFLSSQIYRILLESHASETAARVNAMEQASKNAKELIEELTLHMNKVRQTMITTQILDIVGTGEAMQ